MVKGNYMDNLGEVIRKSRGKAKLTLQQLANISGVSPSHIARIENGMRYPSAKVLQRIAQPLGFKLHELYKAAGYLPLENVGKYDYTPVHGLDPEVAHILAKEPVEIQKKVVKMLAMIKNPYINMS